MYGNKDTKQLGVVPGSPCSAPGKLTVFPSLSDPNPHFLDRLSRVQKDVYEEPVQIRSLLSHFGQVSESIPITESRRWGAAEL
ncbi:hypothetical protein K443DRAFT_685717, partial [Laccaria amethystina LaAM-08-1]